MFFKRKNNYYFCIERKKKQYNKVKVDHMVSQLNRNSEKSYLGKAYKELERTGGHHTAREIDQQPSLWIDTYKLISRQETALKLFLNEVYSNENLEIILTGAGTSAFIGKILEGPFQKNTGKSTRAIATTDLLSHPQHYFNKKKATLLISFGRSGNSPESEAVINIADSFHSKIYHIIITCCPAGKLATTPAGNNSYLLLLPYEACDLGLAMTGSFSSMLLAGILVSRIHEISMLFPQIKQLATYGERIIKEYTKLLEQVARIDFERAVFLGSGPLQGTARESHLKLQEMSDGKIICKCDSFLGFRHGPKAVINKSTLIVYLFSNDFYVHQYETDLVNDINAGEKGIYQIGISESGISKDLKLDLSIVLTEKEEAIDEEFLSVCSVLPTQILSFFKSLQMGLKPDSPSQNGTITRVVQGVNIYPISDMEF